jgi:hypothetical protein
MNPHIVVTFVALGLFLFPRAAAGQGSLTVYGSRQSQG